MFPVFAPLHTLPLQRKQECPSFILGYKNKGVPKTAIVWENQRDRISKAPQFSKARDGYSRSQLCVQGCVSRRGERAVVETALLVNCSELGHLVAFVLVSTSGLLQSFCKACPHKPFLALRSSEKKRELRLVDFGHRRVTRDPAAVSPRLPSLQHTGTRRKGWLWGAGSHDLNLQGRT